MGQVDVLPPDRPTALTNASAQACLVYMDDVQYVNMKHWPVQMGGDQRVRREISGSHGGKYDCSGTLRRVVS
jgi:hypothetical protein